MRIAKWFFALIVGACAQLQPATAPTHSLALDHVWFATQSGALAERAALERAGFRIAPNINRHDGQGTASITVEFENGYLELIYADDSVGVSENGAVGKQRFIDRANWRNTGEAPFGVQLARTAMTPSSFPFETWRISSEWMGAGEYLEMLTPRGSRALTLSIPPHATDVAANMRAIAAGGDDAAKFLHPNGARRITGVRIVAPSADALPPSADFVNASGAARLEVGHDWLMVLTLDGQRQRRSRDLRPELPLIVRY